MRLLVSLSYIYIVMLTWLERHGISAVMCSECVQSHIYIMNMKISGKLSVEWMFFFLFGVLVYHHAITGIISMHFYRCRVVRLPWMFPGAPFSGAPGDLLGSLDLYLYALPYKVRLYIHFNVFNYMLSFHNEFTLVRGVVAIEGRDWLS